MPPLTPKQIARVEGVCKHSLAFMRIRAAEVARAKPEFGPAMKGMIWRKMAALRKTLSEIITLGNESFVVADILMSEDEAKKTLLMDERKEVSLFFQIVATDDMDQQPDKRIHIYDLHSFYVRLDERIGRLSEMVVNWAWWDLSDSVNMLVFEQAAQRFEALKTSALPPQVIQAYRIALNRAADAEVKREDMLACEEATCRRVIDRWTARHEKEPHYRTLVAFEPVAGQAGQSDDEVIMEIATHLTAIARIRESPTLDERVVAYYSDLLKKPAHEITADAVIEYESGLARALKSDLWAILERERIDGQEPYDYKARLLDDLKKRLEAMRGGVKKA